MSHRRAKKLRNMLLQSDNPEDGQRMSRGAIMRLLTKYTHRVHSVHTYPWPLDKLYGPMVFTRRTTSLDPKCPRAVYKTLKRST